MEQGNARERVWPNQIKPLGLESNQIVSAKSRMKVSIRLIALSALWIFRAFPLIFST